MSAVLHASKPGLGSGTALSAHAARKQGSSAGGASGAGPPQGTKRASPGSSTDGAPGQRQRRPRLRTLLDATGKPRTDAPSVRPGSAHAQQIADGPLAAAMLPSALLTAPPEIEIRLGSEDGPSGAARQAALELAERGVCLCRCGLDPKLTVAAAAEAAALHADGELGTMGFVEKGVGGSEFKLQIAAPARASRI